MQTNTMKNNNFFLLQRLIDCLFVAVMIYFITAFIFFLINRNSYKKKEIRLFDKKLYKKFNRLRKSRIETILFFVFFIFFILFYLSARFLLFPKFDNTIKNFGEDFVIDELLNFFTKFVEVSICIVLFTFVGKIETFFILFSFVLTSFFSFSNMPLVILCCCAIYSLYLLFIMSIPLEKYYLYKGKKADHKKFDSEIQRNLYENNIENVIILYESNISALAFNTFYSNFIVLGEKFYKKEKLHDVMYHEIAHIKYNHVKKHFLMKICLLFTIAIPLIYFVYSKINIMSYSVELKKILYWSYLYAIGFFIMFFAVIFNNYYGMTLEYEADNFALENGNNFFKCFYELHKALDFFDNIRNNNMIKLMFICYPNSWNRAYKMIKRS